MMEEKTFNIIQAFVEHAELAPIRTAIVVPVGRDAQGRSKTVQLSFKQLNRLCDQYAHGFLNYGFGKKDRVLLMVRPGIDLIAIVLALIKMGAVPVIIDPGMGVKALAQCVSEAGPTGFIGIPPAHILRLLCPKAFRNIKRHVTAGRRWFWGGADLKSIRSNSQTPFPVADTTAADEAVIAFTSGGTGIPKGVVYSHGMAGAILESLRSDLKMTPGEVHLAAFYAFALFMPSLGVTTVVPDMDPRRTARVNPAYLVEAIHAHGVTNSMGSPIIWEKVADYCRAGHIRLPSVKHVFMFGAEVSPDILKDFVSILDRGRAYTPYGATEALPLTNIGHEEIINETAALTARGAGVCVGRPIARAVVRIIPITDAPVPDWDDALSLPDGRMGEIVARGPAVSRAYLNRPQKTAESKIYSPAGVWHRMGDLGYFDDKGRLWFCGRMVHRVETPGGLLTPVQCETIFNHHPDVKRTALVGIGPYGAQRPVILAEPRPHKKPLSAGFKKDLVAQLLELGQKHAHTRQIKDILIYDRPFPVDVRHNSKIQRHKLAQWARMKLK
ncbi:MAG: fatty acid CoA ligase family protein [Desulfobacterales bacterium]|nr:fatty acid CoA ligase family protein [Desulfobacterales bacterium]